MGEKKGNLGAETAETVGGCGYFCSVKVGFEENFDAVDDRQVDVFDAVSVVDSVEFKTRLFNMINT